MISASGLAKYFGGKRALGPVSFEIGRGETVGFLGLNGAGKTTTLRILAGDLRPSAGSLIVNGSDAIRDPIAVRRLVGFLPEQPPLYPDMTVDDYLCFAGRLRGMAPADVKRRVADVEELIELKAVRGELIRNLSQGYRQRVGLAQAVIHEPELLILDEPAHDLDPAQIVEMRTLLGTLREHHTILVSSHNLPEISQTCDRLLVLDGGEIIASGSEPELAARWLDTFRIEVAIRLPNSGSEMESVSDAATLPPVAAAITALRSIDGVRGITARAQPQEGGASIHVESGEDRRAEISRTLVEGGFDVIRLELSRDELESVFLELVRGAERARDRDHPAA
jgi:ABC-2 type transport system ATP-binding protein